MLFMLNVNPEVPEVTLMVPEGAVHVGCVTLTVGAAGVAGRGFITTTRPADIQP